MESTDEQSFPDRARPSTPTPGLAIVWRGRRPTLQIVAAGAPITLGRSAGAGVAIEDRRMSRLHAEVSHGAAGWTIRDLGSHNGTYVDGAPLVGRVTSHTVRVIRTGDTLAIPCDDIARLHGAVEVVDAIVAGPTLRAAFDAIAIAARTSRVIHLTGETGAGKELAARRFHHAGPGGPFVAVNCAAIPAALAESLLFGVKKGAFSGADADRDGYLASSDGGTLFLDEIGELGRDLQAKLLRALETGEVLAVGATRPRRVELRVCSATHHSLRALVAGGRFREDLYYRLGRPTVAVPALRDRREDIGFLAASALARCAPGLSATATLIEQLLLRPWPGNARELLAELGDAAARALAATSEQVSAEHLDAAAGMPFAEVTRTAAEIDPTAVRTVLEAAGGNVTAAARALGLHRTQLRRFLAKQAAS